MPNCHETIQDSARHKRNYLGLRYRHEKPVCRPSFLKTNQESCKWLIFSKQRHRMLISSPQLPSQKESETNPSREQKDTAVFANRNWSKIKSLHSQKSPRWTKQMYVTKEKMVAPNVIKKFCMQPRNGCKTFDKIKPEPRPTRKPRPDLQFWVIGSAKHQRAVTPITLHNSLKVNIYKRFFVSCSWGTEVYAALTQ